jgi:hypothetical protein
VPTWNELAQGANPEVLFSQDQLAHLVKGLEAMGAPTVDAETLAAYFHPILPTTWEDPEIGPLLRRLLAEEPDIIHAVADVDRSLIFDAIEASPEERVARTFSMAAFIERTRQAMGNHEP